MTTLKERFEHEWRLAFASGDSRIKYPTQYIGLVVFFRQELHALAEQVEKGFAHKFGRGKYEELVYVEMLSFLTTLIRSKADELN